MRRRMSPLEPLAPDQRAVVALVLQQGRSYDEIADLLGIPVDAVRARAHAGLAALAPANGLPGEVTAPLADYLLGQQPDADADATRGLLAESPPARAWATDVAERLADVAKAPLPDIPGEAPARRGRSSRRAGAGDEPPAAPAAAPASAVAPPPGPRPRPVREAAGDGDGSSPPASSKLGGLLLIAAVVAVVAVVLFLVLRGGDDEEPASTAGPTATATATATAQARVADEIKLRPTAGGKPKGTMTVYLQGDDQLLFALQAEDLPPSTQNTSYAVWLTGPGSKARRLGFTNPVGDDGKLGIQGPSEKDFAAFPRLYATYANVVVSEESTEDAKRPRKVVLSGKLPAGR
jgi:hypothetical protein